MATEKKPNIYEKLQAIQSELKAPKDQYNSFGGYKYRSAESILSALKPLCEKHRAVLKLTDTVDEIGGRVYIVASVSIRSIDEPSQQVTAVGYAREPEQKKGMDSAQVTGAASSYARKYALNGLFAIDDTKDPDTDEYYRQTNRQTKKKPTPKKSGAKSLTEEQVLTLQELIDEAGFTDTDVCKKYKVDKLSELPEGVYKMITKSLNSYIEEHHL